jgi:imidazolonepropionase-like amidohydrolase
MGTLTLVRHGQASFGAADYDLLIKGGRVMDPSRRFDQKNCDVAVRGGKIAAISEGQLNGKLTIEAKGLVVAPGFIDVHTHIEGGVERNPPISEGLAEAEDFRVCESNRGEKKSPPSLGESVLRLLEPSHRVSKSCRGNAFI